MRFRSEQDKEIWNSARSIANNINVAKSNSDIRPICVLSQNGNEMLEYSLQKGETPVQVLISIVQSPMLEGMNSKQSMS